MATPPEPHVRMQGLRHLALKVRDLPRSRAFYESLFGMQVVWQPDPENIYLSSGTDNLALHQIPAAECAAYPQGRGQLLDHFGFLVESEEMVDRFFERAEQLQISIVQRPKRHRDGSYSFYLSDPDGNIIQVLYEPTISKKE